MRQRPEWTAKVLKQFTANNSPDFDWLENQEDTNFDGAHLEVNGLLQNVE